MNFSWYFLFFFFWEANTQLNHWTTQLVSSFPFLWIFFFYGFVATHLERKQVEARSLEAPRSKALPQWTMDLMTNAYTCIQIKEKRNKTLFKKHGTWMKDTHRETRISFYRLLYFWLLLYIFHCLFDEFKFLWLIHYFMFLMYLVHWSFCGLFDVLKL